MENTEPVFDTHTDIQELIKSGMPEPQAETLVHQRVRLFEHDFTTTVDIEMLRQITKTDTRELIQSGMPEAQAETVVRQLVRQFEQTMLDESGTYSSKTFTGI